ncbi:MAG: MFS transporter [Gemmatimonadota bacterium]|nr:MFS transporter [Gemmatimonadota bacterium]
MTTLTNLLIVIGIVVVVGAMFGRIPRNLRVLMLTAFVDMVGVLMVAPLLPFYARELGADAVALAVITGAFSAAQLLSAPLWGRVSDRYGRKPALIIGLAASAVSYVVFAYADSIWLLFLSRVVQGAGGGTVGVIQAYVSDAVAPKERAKGLGWLSAATNAGVTLGPLIGSATTTMGERAPGLLAAALCLVNIAFVGYVLHETHGTEARAKAKAARSPREAVWRTIRHPGEPASRLIWIYSVSIGAFYGVAVSGVLTFFLIHRFQATVATIGFFFAYNGVLNVVFRALVLGRVIDKLGEAQTNRLGIAVLALGLFVLPLTHSLPALAVAAALLPLGATFTFPAVTAMLSQVVGDYERGTYMGVQQTFGGIVRVVYPFAAAWAWDYFVTDARGATIPVVPFWMSAALVAAMLLLTSKRRTYGLRTGEHPAAAAD